MSEVRVSDSNGNKIDEDIESIQYVNQVNKIPYAHIVLRKDSDLFNSDKEITLEFDDNHKFVGLVGEKLKQVKNGVYRYNVKLTDRKSVV